MPNVSNPMAGTEAIASAEVIYQTRICLPSGSMFFLPSFDPQLLCRLDTVNTPNLHWYLFLETGYLQQSPIPVVVPAQLDISWQPVVQRRRAAGLNAPLMTLPFTAPAILPVGTPVRLNARSPVVDIGIRFNAPSLGVPTVSSIQILLAASQ